MKFDKWEALVLIAALIAFTITMCVAVTADSKKCNAGTIIPPPILLPIPAQTYSPDDVDLLSQVIYGEARGLAADEQRLVVWTVLNRLDKWGGTIETIVTAPNQFVGYHPDNPVTMEHWRLCLEVLQQWERGESAVVILPYAVNSEYMYFAERDNHNYFRGVY